MQNLCFFSIAVGVENIILEISFPKVGIRSIFVDFYFSKADTGGDIFKAYHMLTNAYKSCVYGLFKP